MADPPYERIFKSTPDAVFVAEIETGDIVAANPAAADTPDTVTVRLTARDRQLLLLATLWTAAHYHEDGYPSTAKPYLQWALAHAAALAASADTPAGRP